MTVEPLDKETDRKLQKLAPARLDINTVDEAQPDELKDPLKFVSTRLRKKIMVRRAIRESRTQQDRASRDTPSS